MKKTIAQELGITKFPFEIRDDRGNLIYMELDDGYWSKRKYDLKGFEIYYETSESFWGKWERELDGEIIYYENSDGQKIDNRPKPAAQLEPKPQAEPMTIEIDGKKYKLIEI
jgi:hypothetical protein